ncbi:hypothetical protein DYB30_009585 [Aphanomyces astaci]|uniref:GH18 domain-containing protein n=2 Tax=Aphanomyces astaci TaxID=112090 RepID=A0A397DJJ5_APHAT|nr:hypothetical protein DYB38_010383 [Aphanomyces astaci]RHY76350.1 hypothetical protein DYB30_009585 [Aphanomyces astaci]RHZ17706.1 hypothetical protein DYB31_004013 [Aphanomyces astaci]RHZ41522.1 hypothetical protein DYB26_008651 [Aphanomyces astaci]
MKVVAAALLSVAASVASAAKLKSVVYYMEWAIYQRNFGIFDLDWSRITHVNYAFGRPRDDGTVDLYDTWAATDKRFIDHGDSWNDLGKKNVYGSFGQANKLKKQFRGTKFGLSIGGWTLSDKFSGIANSDVGRRNFARSAVGMMLDLGLDFIDLDWEYPVEGGNPQPAVPHRPDDIAHYVALLQAIRDEFKALAFPAELSIASPVGPDNYRHWDFKAMCALVDHVNVMAYDLSGSWSEYTDHQANLYEDPTHPPGLKYSVDKAVQDYIKGGCPSNKIVLGMPLYGRSFENTDGLYGQFKAPSNQGSWVAGNGDGAGVWDFKALPLPGAVEYYDNKLVAAYSYNPDTRTFVSYESPSSLEAKLAYIHQHKLGGAMFWAGDADAPAGSARSLITQTFTTFGKDNMDFHENNLEYPTSQYDNIRNSSIVQSSTSVRSTASTTKPPPAAPQRAPATMASLTVTSTTTTGTFSQCDGKRNSCVWPLTKQVVPYQQRDCKAFAAFVWCP